MKNLAINGGSKFIEHGLKPRFNIGVEEKNAVMALFDKAISTGHAIGYNGEEETAFCSKFCDMMGGGYADGVNSGTTAVFVALRALELEPFSEVIVSPITDPGGMMPIVMNNCIPVVADSDEGTYNIGPKQIEEKITKNTKAVIVAHIMGEPCDMEGIMEVARKYDLKVVEDCAQSHFALLNGKPVGSFGHVASFSTMFGKHFNTGGQGGIVYTKDHDLYWKIRQYADRGKPFGLAPGSSNTVASLNFNMDDFGAAIGIVQLDKVKTIIAKRRQLVDYMKTKLSETKTLTAPEIISGAEPSYWFFRIEIDESKLTCSKNTFLEAVIAEGVDLLKDYSIAMPYLMDWFVNEKAFGTGHFPWSASQYQGTYGNEFVCENAANVCKKCFNLHLYESWTTNEIDQIIGAFKKVEDVYCQ
ncbi:MAG: DegT/DnrJ/EryC1/StrS family aminotransferase [Clostridia bacterium]|nr:DegT/DnrJ/EryC1/StrS family aminotransferase [Clostridia bacterium]